MARSKHKKNNPPPWFFQMQQRLREGWMIVLLALSLLLFVSLLSYEPHPIGNTASALNTAGHLGAGYAALSFYLFGVIAYFFPLIIALWAFALFKQRNLAMTPGSHLLVLRGVGFLTAMIAGCALAELYFVQWSILPDGPGGILGQAVSARLVRVLNHEGSSLILLAAFLSGVTFATGISWLALLTLLGQRIARMSHVMGQKLQLGASYFWNKYRDYRADRWVQTTIKPKIAAAIFSPESERTPERLESLSQPAPIKPVVISAPPVIKKAKRTTQQIPLFDSEGLLPSLTLLDPPQEESIETYTPQMLENLSKQVEETLANFSVIAKVVAVHPGPVITRFELELAPGIKASKITGLARDIARSLSMVSVRVVEIIPGKSVIGLELPNVHRQTVSLSEVLSSQVYEKSDSPLSLALGKDIAGHPVVVDLGKMPHLLVAGTTGAGKSVGLNAMLISMLFKAGPEDVRFIMIDPKMLELSVYDGIPHLLTPVVTDMKEASNALRWCVAEMEKRYRLMAALGVRNLTGYNRKVLDAIKNKTPILDPLWPEESLSEAPELTRLPYIVVVVDEFADMIMVVGKKVEELIARIAQKARAAGIHLILATQRPSVDVITGLIKANVPARIAFQVASRIDSRTILDQQGAEQLLGRGDMLYLPVGAGLPMRVHGAFVSDQEVHAVAHDWKLRGAPEYQDDILAGHTDGGLSTFSTLDMEDEEDDDKDSLYDQAVQIVIESRRASISSIQRRLRIGYNRAARLVEQMETAGIVSPVQSNGTREVLIQKQA